MPEPSYHDPRVTERRNPASARIDVASPLEIADLMHEADRSVPLAVAAEREAIAQAIELAERAIRAGGRLVYVGAGTSGRLGVLDAAECPPTFGIPPEMVIGIIAGGYPALVRSQEGAEDDVGAAIAAIDTHEVGASDFVIGIAASGTTPFVRAALGRAQALGALTGLVSCSPPPPVLRETCDVVIVPVVGPELITGSTRLKAGTATKLVLNAISTGAMLRLGKVYGNLMVDLQATSAKLRDRGERIVMEVCGTDRETARDAIARARGSVKVAIVMVQRGVGWEEAVQLIEAGHGFLRHAIGDPPPVPEE